MILNLGTDCSLPAEQWKGLANRNEQIVIGQDHPLPCPARIETLATRCGHKLIGYQGATQGVACRMRLATIRNCHRPMLIQRNEKGETT
jgi:hypothetical protein